MIMHNGQMANPLNPIVIKLRGLTGKRKKTDSDIEAISRLQHRGGLYTDEANTKVILPGENVEACLFEAAKKEKNGKLAKCGVIVEDALLDFPNKKTKLDDLYDIDEHRFVKGVVISRMRVFTTRPKFNEWSATIKITYDDNVVELRQVDAWLVEAGQNIGVGDWRPKYGRFSVAK